MCRFRRMVAKRTNRPAIQFTKSGDALSITKMNMGHFSKCFLYDLYPSGVRFRRRNRPASAAARFRKEPMRNDSRGATLSEASGKSGHDGMLLPPVDV